MISAVFYVIAVSCQPGFLCDSQRFTTMPEFTSYQDCENFRASLASVYSVENGVWVCVTDPAESKAGGSIEGVILTAGI